VVRVGIRVIRRFAAALVCLFAISSADAAVMVRVDKSRQRMTISVDGEMLHDWAVSTGRSGYGTPNGNYQPKLLARRWFSRQYYNSPMPHSIFFHKGFAIHGSHEIRRLGGPASHGCVRLHPQNAEALYALVREHGKENTEIVVTGDAPATRAYAEGRRHRHYASARHYGWPRYRYRPNLFALW